MSMSRRLRLVGAWFVVGALLAGCRPSEDGGDDAVTSKRSALVTNLFVPYVAYPTGSRPEVVAIGDLDGDGRNDVAMTTATFSDPANDYKLNVFIQASDGTLAARVQYPFAVSNPRSIDVGDINGDGRADVVIGNSFGAGSSIFVFLQNASGTLDPVVSIPTLGGSRVRIGDFNGDGRMDVAGLQSGYEGDGLYVFLQTETGALAEPVTYHVPHGPGEDLAAGDVNGDGRTDLVVTSGLSVMLQNSDGTLAEPVSYAVGGGAPLAGVAVGDANGDGRADVVVTYGSAQPYTFFARLLQNAQGTLDAPVAYATRSNPGPIAVADMDADGRKDVLVLHDVALGVYRQTTAGDYRWWTQEIPPMPATQEQPYPVPYAAFYKPQTLAIGDISGDGRPDVAIASPNVGLAVLRHTTTTEPTVTITAPAPGAYPVGQPLTLTWTASDDVIGFYASASFDGGVTYSTTVCLSVPATGRSCTWASPGPAAAGVRIKVGTQNAAGNTGSAETIVDLINPAVSVTAPATGAVLTPGSPATITWSSNFPASATVRVELSRNGGSSFETLAAAAPNTGSFAWTVTEPETSTARVRVTGNSPFAAATSTGGTFYVVSVPLTVTSPAAGAIAYTGGLPLTVTWTMNVVASSVRIEISFDGGGVYQPLAFSAPNFGTYTATTYGPPTSTAIVRVTTLGTTTVSATSGLFNLVTPTMAVDTPVAGTTAFVGAPLAITWHHNFPPASTMRVELSRDGGPYTTLAASAPDTGSFAWTATGPDSSNARVRVSTNGPLVQSITGAFTIVTPTLTVTGPAGGSTAFAGAPVAITWTSNLPATATALIELSRDGGASFETLAADAPNTGSFAWTAGGPDAASAIVRVTLNGPPVVSATSLPFGITTAVLSVTAPGAGTSWSVGAEQTVTWSTNLPAGATVLVELSRDGGGSFETLAAGAPDTGSFTWTVGGPDTAAAIVRVSASDPVPASASSGVFAIVTPPPVLAVTAPVAGASWAIGTTQAITWTSALPPTATVRIELSRNNGTSYTTLAASAPNTGSFSWTVTGAATAAARVRVSANGAPAASAVSDPFSIVAAVTVTSPNTAVIWLVGSVKPITWTHHLGAGAQFKIAISRNGGSTWSLITAAAPAGATSGSYDWTVAAPRSETCRIRVTWTGNSASKDTSNTNFRIR